MHEESLFQESFGRSPKYWHERRFMLPHTCAFCRRRLWGQGYIGYVYWSMDEDKHYSHPLCLAEWRLGGGQN